mgnify:CR=1 FL=1
MKSLVELAEEKKALLLKLISDCEAAQNARDKMLLPAKTTAERNAVSDGAQYAAAVKEIHRSLNTVNSIITETKEAMINALNGFFFA